LLSWLFPSPADRVALARKELAAGRPHEARLEVLDVDHPEAPAVLEEAENALALANLEAAIGHCRSGDDVRAAEHLELAERFHQGAHAERFKTARRELRTIRADRAAALQRAREEEQARLLGVDPLGVTGGPSLLDPTADHGAFDADREELEARLALLVEGYPEHLRDRVTDLGADFAQAVLDLDEGQANLALQTLLGMPDDDPLVCWERARAAYALGDPAAAARALRAFAREAGGHHPVGNRHSATFLAQCLAESGDVAGGLRVLRSARADEPKLGGLLFASLLHAKGDLEEAETELVRIVREHPRSSQAYVLLAQVRLTGGHRTQAMRALEASLEATCCSPGQCGYQPPDLATHRMLATLYLEDGIERERALELAETARGLVRQPQWGDLYLAALAAKSTGQPDAPQLIDRLRQVTPPGTPQAERVASL
jgi:tetratricopeptide (TPR) repeat protein